MNHKLGILTGTAIVIVASYYCYSWRYCYDIECFHRCSVSPGLRAPPTCCSFPSRPGKDLDEELRLVA